MRTFIWVLLLALLLAGCGGGSSDGESEDTTLAVGPDSDNGDASGSSGSPAENTQSPMGVNITGVKYWSTEWHLVDAMKRASNGEDELWLAQCDSCVWNTAETLDLDALGWPRSLPAEDDPEVEYRYLSTIFFLGARGHYPEGEYTVLYDGEGLLEYQWNAWRIDSESEPGRDVIDVTAGEDGFLLTIRETDPNHTGNYLRNIRVIYPGGTCDNDPFFYAESTTDCDSAEAYRPFTETYGAQPFHPLFLSDLRAFRSVRFMQISETVDSQVVQWSERTRLEHASWGRGGSQWTGIPYERVAQLANTLTADPWVTVPARADDDYIRQMARLFLEQLDGQHTLYIEYYNEVWNTAFPFEVNGAWIQEQGVAEWPGGPESDYTKRLNWFAKRTVEACELWREIWGEEAHRIHCVMGSFVGIPWVSEQVLECPLHAADNGGRPCSEFVDSIAIAPYFGGYLADERFMDSVAAWTGDSDGGLGALFEEVFDGRLHDPNDEDPAPEGGALQEVYELIDAHAAIAQTYDKALLAYEGGQHMTMFGNQEGDAPAISELFSRANRDPRMAEAYDALFAYWRDHGGRGFVSFESVSPNNIWGNFGNKEYQNQARAEAPKFDAVMRFIENSPCWWTECGLE